MLHVLTLAGEREPLGTLLKEGKGEQGCAPHAMADTHDGSRHLFAESVDHEEKVSRMIEPARFSATA